MADKHELTVLDNGVRVITRPSPSAQGAHVKWILNAGSSAEPRSQTSITEYYAGAAHFLEHLLVDQERFAKPLMNYGGSLKAATSFSCISLSASVPAAFATETIDRMLEHTLVAPKFTQVDFDHEYPAIFAEAMRYQDKKGIDFRHKHFEKAFGGAQYAKSIVGEPGELEALDANKLHLFHRGTLAAPNIVVVAAGAVDHQQVVRQAEYHLGHLRGEARFKNQSPLLQPDEYNDCPANEPSADKFGASSDVSERFNALQTIGFRVISPIVSSLGFALLNLADFAARGFQPKSAKNQRELDFLREWEAKHDPNADLTVVFPAPEENGYNKASCLANVLSDNFLSGGFANFLRQERKLVYGAGVEYSMPFGVSTVSFSASAPSKKFKSLVGATGDYLSALPDRVTSQAYEYASKRYQQNMAYGADLNSMVWVNNVSLNRTGGLETVSGELLPRATLQEAASELIQAEPFVQSTYPARAQLMGHLHKSPYRPS